MTFDQRIPRRQFLSGVTSTALLGTGAFGVTSAAAARDPATSMTLKEAAQRSRLFWGTAVYAQALQPEREFSALVARESSVLVPEWEMKWAAIERNRGQRRYTLADLVVTFAQAHQLKIRGHTLVWHLSIPDWAKAALKETRDWNLVASHITAMLQRYGGNTFKHWDVVNEMIEPNHGRDDGLRVSPFLETFGPDYISKALILAREIAPDVKLYINEYGVDYNTSIEKARRIKLLRLVENLKKAGAPLDGVGIQGHLRIDGTPFSAPALRDFLRDLAGLNVPITITELDVRERDKSPPLETRDRLVADELTRYLDTVLQEPAIDGIVSWGLSDRYSWLTTPKLRANGEINRGLPFDESMSPKPAVTAIVEALGRRPARKANVPATPAQYA
jgi:endo-1,4-beta-xylanase